MVSRSYHQACSVANFLDRLGSRWSLLIVRDLLVGPRRFKELLAGLPGIGPNRLTDRLRDLQQDEIVAKAMDARGQPVYALTEKGRALEPVILAMAGWGLRYLPPLPEDGQAGKLSRPDLLVVAFRAVFRPEAASGIREAYEFRVDHTVFFVKVDDGKVETGIGMAEHPAFVFIATTDTFDRIAAGSLDMTKAEKRGLVEILGDRDAYDRCARIFGIPRSGEERLANNH